MKSASRSYASPLREEQAAATKRRIVEALAALLDESQTADVSLAEVAHRAGVAERTLYRHFPTKFDLYFALYQWVAGEPAAGDNPRRRSVEEVVALVRQVYPAYARHPRVLRSMNTIGTGEDVRRQRAPERRASVERAIGDIVKGLPPKKRRRVLAVINLLSSSDAFLHMHDFWGLDGDEAAEAVAWAIRTLTDSVRERGMP